MIHSLSGGVISDNESLDFAKVEVEGVARWYLTQIKVNAGDCVLVSFGYLSKEGVVVKTERCTRQCAPAPLRGMGEIEALLPQKH